MTSRTPQATSRQTTKTLQKRVFGWLRKVLVAILLFFVLCLLLVGIEKWRRQQVALAKLGNDPIMSKNLLGMRFIKQEIKVNDVIFNWKPSSPEVINYFETKGDQREIFDQLVKFAQENGWKDVSIYHGNMNDMRFSAHKPNLSLHIRVYSKDKGKNTIYIKNQ